jgi:tetratricopeptide (TPR) repeat protein
MDALEIEFKRLLRLNDCEAAHKALDRWLEKTNPSRASLAHWRATTFARQGDYKSALSALTNVIHAGEDRNELCRVARAGIYLRLSKWSNALADYDIILSSGLPVVKRSFQASARFMKAYILARQGEGNFAT